MLPRQSPAFGKIWFSMPICQNEMDDETESQTTGSLASSRLDKLSLFNSCWALKIALGHM